MCLDTGTVYKRYVLCPHCKEDYLFTLRAIAHNPELTCHGCGGSIRLSDRVYRNIRNASPFFIECPLKEIQPARTARRCDPVATGCAEGFGQAFRLEGNQRRGGSALL
jgi:hypothetical protein